MAYQVFSCHRRSNIRLPDAASLDEVKLLAEAAASLGNDAFYRCFEIKPGTISGIQFATAFSVLGGKVVEHASVTFPAAHW
jgi:hypothetical protein